MTQKHNPGVPLSNRGHTRTPQKTNLQMTPVLDRVRLETVVRHKPEKIHASLLGNQKTTPSRTMYRGPQPSEQMRSWDSPKNTPGGLYLQTDYLGHETIVQVEYNPQQAPWKYDRTLVPLSEALGVPLADWWVRRYDVAIDIHEPRERYTLAPSGRRKVELIFPSGGMLETAFVRPTKTYPGVMIYDKAVEQKEKHGHKVDHPWTRVEIRVETSTNKNQCHLQWGELGKKTLPRLGASVKRFHYEREDFHLDKQTSLHFAHLQELATYNPERARIAMRELAATKGLGEDAYECLLDDVQIERAWERSGRDAVDVVIKTQTARQAS